MKAQILLHIIVVVLSLDAELGEGGGESSVQYWYSSSSTLVHWLVYYANSSGPILEQLYTYKSLECIKTTIAVALAPQPSLKAPKG